MRGSWASAGWLSGLGQQWVGIRWAVGLKYDGSGWVGLGLHAGPLWRKLFCTCSGGILIFWDGSGRVILWTLPGRVIFRPCPGRVIIWQDNPGRFIIL